MSSNPYQVRFSPMSSSSMFTSSPSHDFPRTAPTLSTTAFDPFNRAPQSTNFLKVPDTFPKALASQSMIATRSVSSSRATSGKLDSMARKVVTTFKEEPLQEPQTKKESPFTGDESVSQSLIVPGAGKPFFSLNNMQQTNKLTLDSLESAPKKRRESIDLGKLGGNPEMTSFLRKAPTNQPQMVKHFSSGEQDLTAGGNDGQKQKNFEFLRKRKEANGSETTSSMISTNHIQGVQSMKNLQQFNMGNNFKKQDFFSPSPKQPINDIKCPEDKPRYEINIKAEQPSNHSFSPNPTPNFQFKKKKAFEVPLEMAASKPQSTEPLTAKQRRNARPQRQIKLSDFELLEKLGKGAFGQVFMAQQKNIGFVCVIKKMSKKRIHETKVQNHILRQIKIQSYLNHANLTSLFGYFHDQEYLYLILEALPDGSLQQVKKKRKLPQRETAAIVKQVSDGLKYMHEQCIIHRDLKPQNLFVNDNVIKIGDFGCSIFNQNSGLRTTVVGCLEYSSPEQLNSEGYSEKIDAWSLGILTYELLFGKSPFQKDIINITRNKQAQAKLSELTFPASIAIKDSTKDFIENLLAENPDKRMDMDQVLAHEFLREQVNKRPLRLDII